MKPTGLNTVFSTSVMTAGVVFAALGVSPDAHAQSSCGMTTIRLPNGSTTTTGTPCQPPPAATPIPGGSSSDNSKGDVIKNSLRVGSLWGMAGLGPAASQLSGCNYMRGWGVAFGPFAFNSSQDAETILGCNEAMLKMIFVERSLESDNPALITLAVHQVVGEEGLSFLKTQAGQEAMALFAVAAAPTGYGANQGAPAQTTVVRVETSPACPSQGSVNNIKPVKSRTQAMHRSCNRN